MFPKGCFGCVLFSIIMTGYQLNKKQIAIKFFKEYTNGWFTDMLYDLTLASMMVLYKILKYNQKLTDRYQLVCLRFTSCKETQFVFKYFSKIGSKIH